MTFELRDYQRDMIDRCRDALRRSRSVLQVLPTGGGKTAIGAFMAGTASGRGLRVLFTVHRDFLIRQTVESFARVGIRCGVIAAGRPYNPMEAVQVASIQTLTRRLDKIPPFDLWICDEAHHIPAGSWAKVAAWHTGRAVGLTATPARLDGRGLSDFFDDMVIGPSVGDLIQAGHLAPYRAFAPTAPDLAGVHTRAGDYARDEISDIMDRRKIIGDMVGHYRNLANGARAIYFAVSIRHSQHIAATFSASGIPARHLDASSTSDERSDAARMLARGELRVLSNVDLFGEGYDLAAQAGEDVTIDAVGLARPTQSLVLHMQQIGRALRPKPNGGRAVILDHAGNIMCHGLPDTPREWSLNGIPKRGKNTSSEAVPVRLCPECFATHPAAMGHCPECGAIHETRGRDVTEAEGSLSEIDEARLKMMRRKEQSRARTYDDLVALGYSRGYKNPQKWAYHVWQHRQSKRGVDAAS